MFSIILNIVAIILLSLVGRNIIKIFFYEKLSKINKWVFLVIGIIIGVLPFVLRLKINFLSSIVIALGIILIILFFDRVGILGDKLIAVEKVEEKKVIKPKAKPNRVKNMSEEEKKNQLLK